MEKRQNNSETINAKYVKKTEPNLLHYTKISYKTVRYCEDFVCQQALKILKLDYSIRIVYMPAL